MGHSERDTPPPELRKSIKRLSERADILKAAAKRNTEEGNRIVQRIEDLRAKSELLYQKKARAF